MQIFHKIWLEIIEIAVKVHLDWFVRIFWRFEVYIGYPFEINVKGRLYPRFAHPTLVLVRLVLIHFPLLH